MFTIPTGSFITVPEQERCLKYGWDGRCRKFNSVPYDELTTNQATVTDIIPINNVSRYGRTIWSVEKHFVKCQPVYGYGSGKRFKVGDSITSYDTTTKDKYLIDNDSEPIGFYRSEKEARNAYFPRTYFK